MKLDNKSLVIGNVVVDENNDLMALTSIGKMIRIQNEAIRKTGRSTKGVTLVKIDKKDKVVSIAPCPKEGEEIDIGEDTYGK
jgi:DNA gyrase subunit A